MKNSIVESVVFNSPCGNLSAVGGHDLLERRLGDVIRRQPPVLLGQQASCTAVQQAAAERRAREEAALRMVSQA